MAWERAQGAYLVVGACCVGFKWHFSVKMARWSTPRVGVREMSSSVLPAALRRRRMGLADGLDIGSLLSYGLLITRRELRSSVG